MRLRAVTAAVLGACLVGCSPSDGVFSGTTPNVARGDAASASGNSKTAFAAYERALAADGLMAYERAEVLERMTVADQQIEHLDAAAVYTRVLERERQHLGRDERRLIVSRLLVTADTLAAKRRFRDAAEVYEVALREGKAQIADRKRVVERFRAATNAWAHEEGVRLANAPDDEAKLSALGTVRLAAFRASGRGAAVAELTRAMEATATVALANASRLAKEGDWDAALRLADTLVAPLSRDSAPTQKRNELAAEAATHFETLIAAAQGYPGALALRTGWLLRATGRAHPVRKEALADLDRKARVEWRAVLTTNTCSNASSALVPELQGGKGAPVTAKLDVERCQPDESASTRTEAYTYYVSESYTENESYNESVTEYAGESCTGGGFGSSSTKTCSPQYRTRLVPRTRPVTKTRQVPKTAHRTIVTTSYSYDVRGSVRFVIDDKVLFHPFAGSGTAIHVTTTGGPEGRRDDGGSAATAMRSALDRAVEAIADGKQRVDEERARMWLDKAQHAEAQKRDLEAEDAHVTATRILGTSAEATKSFAKTHLHMRDDPAVALGAEAPPPPSTTKLALSGDGDLYAAPPRDDGTDDNEPEGRASGRERGGLLLEGVYASTNRIVLGGAREAAWQGAGLRASGSLALFSRLVVPFGPTVMDAAHVSLTAGKQFGEITPAQTAAGDPTLFLSADAGYTFLGGYRATRAGIFAGVDPRARTFQIGDLRAYGLVVPFMIRGELRVNGPAVFTLTAWGFSPVTTGDSLGIELGAPLSRSGWVLTARGERSRSATTIASPTAPATRDSISSAELWAFSLGFGKLL